MLGKLTEPLEHSDWVEQIKNVEYAINNTKHRSTGTTPSKLLFEINQRGPNIDYLTEFLEEVDSTVENRDLQSLRSSALDNISKGQEYSQRWITEHCKPAKIYSPGDFVVIRNIDTSAGTNKKIIPKFRGPYTIHKALGNDHYVIRDIDNFQVTQLPYDGVIEAKHIKLWKARTPTSNDALTNDNNITE